MVRAMGRWVAFMIFLILGGSGLGNLSEWFPGWKYRIPFGGLEPSTGSRMDALEAPVPGSSLSHRRTQDPMGLSKEKQKLVHRLRSPRLRAREGLLLVEGVRTATEFLTAARPQAIRFAMVSPRLEEIGGGPEIRAKLSDRGIQVEEVEDGELKSLSDTELSQGILLVVEEPVGPWPPGEEMESPRLLLLDGIQDPGNVGTLVRVARAFGLDGVLALEGTADPWNPKAVRASAGASAHLPLARISWGVAREWLDRRSLPILVAEAGGMDVRDFRQEGGWALVLGNEGAGVRREIRDAARELLAIRMAGGGDSLNVATAGAILLFVLAASQGHGGKV
jgi:TrmH family RNA methyltransferase